jgi:hypothetical protein
VPPGQYTLLARASRPIANPDGSPAPAQMVWASTQIAVDGEPISGVVLSLEPGLTIGGRIRFQESALKRPDPRTIRISARPFDTQTTVSFAPASVTAGADGRFSIAGVIPGRYRLSASFPGMGAEGRWRLESITANAEDALDAVLTVPPNQHILDALVTFTDRMTEISGTVRADATPPTDYTVVLFPDDRRLWFPQSRRIQGTRAGTDGRYTFRGLPSGSYLLALTDDLEPGEWFDPAVLQRIAASAIRVTIADGERKTQDISTGPGSRP